MNNTNTENDPKRNRIHAAFIAATTVAAVLISLYYLSSGWFIVFQNLFYIPIILSCIYYTVRGFIYSVCLALLYMLLILVFTSETGIIMQALIRVALFITIAGIVTFLSIRHKRAQGEREKLILELREALKKVRLLTGLLPVCASCKKIRNDKGYWEQIEVYVRDHSEAEFSHSICPECAGRLYPELHNKK